MKGASALRAHQEPPTVRAERHDGEPLVGRHHAARSSFARIDSRTLVGSVGHPMAVGAKADAGSGALRAEDEFCRPLPESFDREAARGIAVGTLEARDGVGEGGGGVVVEPEPAEGQ